MAFLSHVVEYLQAMDMAMDEDECCGLSFLLKDIADMINAPPSKKAVAE